MKKSLFKNSGNSWGDGVIKDPLGTENPGGWGGVQIKESSVGEVWIFSRTTHSIKIEKVNYAFSRDQKMSFLRTGNELVHTMP